MHPDRAGAYGRAGHEGVVVVADRWPARVAEATAVIPDDAAAGAERRALLALPRVGVERVAVDPDDRESASVILVASAKTPTRFA
jgi:hypothetical protein